MYENCFSDTTLKNRELIYWFNYFIQNKLPQKTICFSKYVASPEKASKIEDDVDYFNI